MNDEKRKCIFTNKPSNAKLQITSDKYSWAKAVPCTKDFLENKGSKGLNELEFRLVELFYEQELVRLRIEHYDTQMAEIRATIQCPVVNKTVKKPRRPFAEIRKDIEDINNRKPDSDLTRDETAPVEVLKECPNPKCPSMLIHAPGIGPFCPNKGCDVGDGSEVWKEKYVQLTEEEQKVEKETEDFSLTEEENPVKVEEEDDLWS